MSRTFLSSSAHLDEAEQLLLTQQWHWGYGSQPPLYTWVQTLFFAAFGPSISGLAVFKNLLLFGMVGLTYHCARRLTRSHVGGMAAAVSLGFIPQVIWESQRDLTHTVLAVVMSLATLLAFLRLVERRRAKSYLIFGLCAGAACLSKYNCLLYVVALLVASLTVRRARSAVLDWRMVLAALAVLPLAVPHGLWVFHHWGEALAGASKLQMDGGHSWWWSASRGLGRLFLSMLLFLGPMVGVQACFFWKAPRFKLAEEVQDVAVLPLRTLGAVVGLAAVLVLAVHATRFSGRWLEPLLITAPVAAAVALAPRLHTRRLRWMAGFSASLAVLVAVMLPARIVLAERLGRQEPLHKPFDTLARALQPRLGPSTVVVADSTLLAGNLRLALKPQLVVTPELLHSFAPQQHAFLLVWDATRSAEMPAKLRDLVREHGATEAAGVEPHYFSATLKYHRTKVARWGLLSIPSNNLPAPPAADGTPPRP